MSMKHGVACRWVALIVAWFLGSGVSLTAFGGEPSQCRADEMVFFSCKVMPSGKTASLCGKNKASGGPYLQYRFGVVGKPPELIVPASMPAQEAPKTFFYYAGGNRYDDHSQRGVWFLNEHVYYELRQELDGSDLTSAVIVYWTPPFKAEKGPKGINCQQKNAGQNLEAAGDLIEEMGPGHIGLSPEDWMIQHEVRN